MSDSDNLEQFADALARLVVVMSALEAVRGFVEGLADCHDDCDRCAELTDRALDELALVEGEEI